MSSHRLARRALYWPSNFAAGAMIASSLTTLGSIEISSIDATYQYDYNFWKIVATMHTSQLTSVTVLTAPTEMTSCSQTLQIIYTARTFLCIVPCLIFLMALTIGVMVCKRGMEGLRNKYFKRVVVIVLIIAAALCLVVGALGVVFWAASACTSSPLSKVQGASWGPSAFLGFAAFVLLTVEVVLQCCVKPPPPTHDADHASAAADFDDDDVMHDLGPPTMPDAVPEMGHEIASKYVVHPNDVMLPMKRIVDRWVKGIDGAPQLGLPWCAVSFLTKNFDLSRATRSSDDAAIFFDTCLVVSVDTIVPMDLVLQRCRSISEASAVVARLGYAARVSPFLVSCYGASVFLVQHDHDVSILAGQLRWDLKVGEAIVAVVTEHVISVDVNITPDQLPRLRCEVAHAVCAARRVGCTPGFVSFTAERSDTGDDKDYVLRACCAGSTWSGNLEAVPALSTLFNSIMDGLPPMLTATDATAASRVESDDDVVKLASLLSASPSMTVVRGFASGLQRPVPIDMPCSACGKVDETTTWKLSDPGVQCIDGHYLCSRCTATVVAASEGPHPLCCVVGCEKELLVATCAM